MESVIKTLEFDNIRQHLADCAATYLGRERAHALSPSRDVSQIQQALTQTTEFRDLIDYEKTPPLANIPDMEPILKKANIQGSLLHPEECLGIMRLLQVVHALQRYFQEFDGKIPALKKVTNRFIPLKDLESELNRCIDIKSEKIKDNASEKLASVRKNITRAQESARKKLQGLLNRYAAQGALQENVIAMRNNRLVLVIKDEYKRKVKGLIHDRSASGSSLFVEPLSVVEDNNRIRELYAEESKEIERILYQLTEKIHQSFDAISNNLETLSEVDFIYAKASLSKKLNAHQPEITKSPTLSIAGGRHPLLLLRMGEKNVVPLDVTLGETFYTLVISGPNAGGKTVALKTVGLLTMMALSGLHIPAKPHSKVGMMQRIFATIGDQQSLDNDLSTFSSHLASLKEIANHAQKGHFVLIDEIGSGTDPEEGIALAMALLECLTKRQVLSIVTTHQSPLKAFAYQTDGVENASLEFDVSTLESTFRFRTGIPGSSYAFEIAQRMNVPQELTGRARELVGVHKDKLEGLILDLDENIQHYKKLAAQATLQETEYRGLLKLYQERYEQLKKEQRQLKQKAAQEADELLKESNAVIEKAIRDIRESQAQSEAIRSAKELLQKEKTKVNAIKQEVTEVAEPQQPADVTIGDFVQWTRTSGTGEIKSSPDKKGRVLLQTDGGMKIRVPTTELVKKNQKRKSKSKVKYHVGAEKRYQNELDIRGLTSIEALDEVDKFLDETLLAGFHEISIVHGKGTGALRKQVHDYLRTHPQVVKYRLGNWNEGDAGVTIVTLKET